MKFSEVNKSNGLLDQITLLMMALGLPFISLFTLASLSCIPKNYLTKPMINRPILRPHLEGEESLRPIDACVIEQPNVLFQHELRLRRLWRSKILLLIWKFVKKWAFLRWALPLGIETVNDCRASFPSSSRGRSIASSDRGLRDRAATRTVSARASVATTAVTF